MEQWRMPKVSLNKVHLRELGRVSLWEQKKTTLKLQHLERKLHQENFGSIPGKSEEQQPGCVCTNTAEILPKGKKRIKRKRDKHLLNGTT